jgi:hypothetical protein
VNITGTVFDAVYANGTLWAVSGPPDPIWISSSTMGGPYLLLRIDSHTLRVTGTFPLDGRPNAVVATAHFVWVSGRSVGTPLTVFPNELLQFGLDGSRTQSYPFEGISDLTAGSGDSVWVEHGSLTQTGFLNQVRDGVVGADIPLGGFVAFSAIRISNLVACPDGVYAGTGAVADQGVISDGEIVNRVVGGRVVGQVTVPADLRMLWLGCGAGHGVVGTAAGWGEQLFTPGQLAGPQVALVSYAHGLGGCDTGVWVGQLWLVEGATRTIGGMVEVGTTPIWFAEPTFAHSSAVTRLPFLVRLTTMDGCNLWTIAEDPGNADRVIIAEITAP